MPRRYVADFRLPLPEGRRVERFSAVWTFVSGVFREQDPEGAGHPSVVVTASEGAEFRGTDLRTVMQEVEDDGMTLDTGWAGFRDAHFSSHSAVVYLPEVPLWGDDELLVEFTHEDEGWVKSMERRVKRLWSDEGLSVTSWLDEEVDEPSESEAELRREPSVVVPVTPAPAKWSRARTTWTVVASVVGVLAGVASIVQLFL